MHEQEHDFRDEEPTWVKYAIYRGGGHDKYYEVRIDMAPGGGFMLTRRWGANPDRGRGDIKTARHTSLTRAISAADTILASKVRKGYREIDRPYAASNQVMKIRGAVEDRDAEAF